MKQPCGPGPRKIQPVGTNDTDARGRMPGRMDGSDAIGHSKTAHPGFSTDGYLRPGENQATMRGVRRAPGRDACLMAPRQISSRSGESTSSSLMPWLTFACSLHASTISDRLDPDTEEPHECPMSTHSTVNNIFSPAFYVPGLAGNCRTSEKYGAAYE